MKKHEFKTTNIRGKQYVEVNERIKFFRQEEQYRNWSIITDFTVLEPDHCVCKASIVDVDNRIVSTGHAHETQGSSNINKTSYVENCETSAIGRAMAMLGIGIDTSIASANEVSDAISKQESMAKNPIVKELSKRLDAPAKPLEDIMGKSIAYIKSQNDKKKAFDLVMKKHGANLSEKQIEGITKFVR